MVTVAVPYHLDERLAAFDVGAPVDREVMVELPAGDAWHRMSALYEQVAQVVAGFPDQVPVVISGDCTTSLGVLAGLQRSGHDVGIVWFDAHADFHTRAAGGYPTTPAMAAGVADHVSSLTETRPCSTSANRSTGLDHLSRQEPLTTR